jgi:putative two-component system response regulator
VLQIADIYDALTSPRPYKPAFTPREALRTIEEETARGWRDPAIVKLFLRVHKKALAKLPEHDRGLEALRGYIGPSAVLAS